MIKVKEENIDRVLNEARRIAIEKAYIPRLIRKNYATRIENGKLIISERKRK